MIFLCFVGGVGELCMTKLENRITDKRFRTLNAKSRLRGLDTHELLQVLDRMIPHNPPKKMDKHPEWKNDRSVK